MEKTKETGIESLWNAILEKQEVRQNLSKIRELIKKEENRKKAREIIGEYELFLEGLLNHSDPKTRKNTVLLIGDLKLEDLKDLVWEGYTKEETLFNKSSYLIAMKHLGMKTYLKEFKEREAVLLQEEKSEENRKHIMEELTGLRSLIVSIEGIRKHVFCGFEERSEIIVLANRKHLPEVLEEIKMQPDICTSDAKLMQAGIRLNTAGLEELLQIRTWSELLFLVPGMKTCPMEAGEAANQIGNSAFLNFLDTRHKGEGAYYFRVEIKSEKVDKAKFIKRFTEQLEELSFGRLINSPSHYEIELRLVENKEGRFNVMVKLFTIEDSRFSYRKEVISSSIRPVNAALIAMLSEKYLQEDGRVLDPFCGVGTMLIERNKKVKADTLYGVDILEDAIIKGRRNAEEAGVPLHFINRDFFSFSHEYTFDEIFTNLPFAQGSKTPYDIAKIYERFFEKIPEVMRKGGKMILYTHDRRLLEKQVEKHGYDFLEKMVINVKEDSWLYVVEV